MFLSLAYLTDRFFYRFIEFFVHWYGHSFFIIGDAAIRTLEYFDRIFAVKIQLRNFLLPLYGDYSPIGRFFGVFFRSLRILIALALYIFISIWFLAAYILWAAIPMYFMMRIIYS
jgi:hypothetical protein